ncbi:MAG: hypothetical protein Q9162_004418 [Coniocarpon cinnabarinum]
MASFWWRATNAIKHAMGVGREERSSDDLVETYSIASSLDVTPDTSPTSSQQSCVHCGAYQPIFTNYNYGFDMARKPKNAGTAGASQDTSLPNSTQNADMNISATQTPAPKRGPGRPRKNQVPPSSAESSAMAAANAASQLMTPIATSSMPQEPNTTANDDETPMDPVLMADLTAATNGVEPPAEEPAQQPGSNKRRRGPNSSGPNKRHKAVDNTENRDPSDSQLQSGPNFPKDGPFTEVERAHIDRFAVNFRNAQGITVDRLNYIVQNKERKMDDLTRNFWSQLYMTLPNRDHKAMQRHVRRRFHNFDKRGNWEPEEDEQLKSLYEQKPNSWKWIGEQLHRMPEDCRDRWRNYVICGDNRRTDHWTEEEEQELSMAVHEAMRDVKNARRRKAQEEMLAFREDQDWLELVNFNDVSEKMHYTRSRLQCLQHWKAIRAREQANKPKRKVHTSRPRPKSTDTSREARHHYEQMLPGDKYQIAVDIRASESSSEFVIPWNLLSQRSTMEWSTTDWKYAWGRMKMLDPRGDFQEQVDAVVAWYEANHAPEELTRRNDGPRTNAPSNQLQISANEDGDTFAIDPVLDNQQGSTAQATGTVNKTSNATSTGGGRRGRKTKAPKSTDRMPSSSSQSPINQTSMLGYIKKGKGKGKASDPPNGHAHPSDHFFAQALSGMPAPTAPMGGNYSQNTGTNISEPELPAIRNEGENDVGNPQSDEHRTAEQQAIAALGKLREE